MVGLNLLKSCSGSDSGQKCDDMKTMTTTWSNGLKNPCIILQPINRWIVTKRMTHSWAEICKWCTVNYQSIKTIDGLFTTICLLTQNSDGSLKRLEKKCFFLKASRVLNMLVIKIKWIFYFLVCSSHRSMEYLKNNLENSSKSIDTVYDCDCIEMVLLCEVKQND